MEDDYSFYCSQCDYKCNYISKWKQHLKTKKHTLGVNDDKICPFCGIIINVSTNMNLHILNKHSTIDQRKEQFKFYCEKCDFGTFSNTLFETHCETNKHIDNVKKHIN